MLLVNIYLLKSSSNKSNNSEDSLRHELKNSNNLENSLDFESNRPRIVARARNTKEEQYTKGTFLPLRNIAASIELNGTEGKSKELYAMRVPSFQPESPSDIYGKVFYDQTRPFKENEYHDWSFMRQMYKIPSLPRVDKINCDSLFTGDNNEILLAKNIMSRREFTKVPVYEETYLEWSQDCKMFKESRGYITVPLTVEEQQFPIAFSISMFTDVEQMERLLRAVYQPQNLYCIHVDVKSSLLIHKTVTAIVNCFDNVFITSQFSKVKWGDVSVLLPHLSCMRDLVKYYRNKWKYFIDLAGQEFPLRTNYEIVQILKIFNGSNDITASHKR